MSHLKLLAHFEAKPGKVDALKAALLQLIPPTRAEAGCLEYELFQDTQNPNHIVFVETWETRETWLAHMETAHITTMRSQLHNLANTFTLTELSAVS